jgi:hypothetical protein
MEDVQGVARGADGGVDDDVNPGYADAATSELHH